MRFSAAASSTAPRNRAISASCAGVGALPAAATASFNALFAAVTRDVAASAVDGEYRNRPGAAGMALDPKIDPNSGNLNSGSLNPVAAADGPAAAAVVPHLRHRHGG